MLGPKFKKGEHVVFHTEYQLLDGIIEDICEETDGHNGDVFAYSYFINYNRTTRKIYENRIIGEYDENAYQKAKEKFNLQILKKYKEKHLKEIERLQQKINSINKELEKNINAETVTFKVFDIENNCYLDPKSCFIDGNGNFFYRDSQGMFNKWNKDFRVEIDNE